MAYEQQVYQGRMYGAFDSQKRRLWLDYYTEQDPVLNKIRLTVTIGITCDYRLNVNSPKVGRFHFGEFVSNWNTDSGWGANLTGNRALRTYNTEVYCDENGNYNCYFLAWLDINVAGTSTLYSQLSQGGKGIYVQLPQIIRYAGRISDFRQTNVSTDFIQIGYSIDVEADYGLLSLNGGAWVDLPLDNTIRGLEANQAYSLRIALRRKYNQAWVYSDTIEVRTNPILVTSFSIVSQLNIDEGKQAGLNILINPSNASNKELKFTISNSNCQLINQDVKALLKGTSTITAVTTDGTNITKQTLVNIVRRVTGIEMSTSKLSLNLGEPFQLNWAVLPNTATDLAVTFSSSNIKCATVTSAGLINPVDIGDCTITVVTNDGKFKETTYVKVNEELSWVDIDLKDTVQYYDINNIYKNQRYIRKKLIDFGYSVDYLDEIKASYNYSFTDMRALFVSIERNFNELNNNDCLSIYWIEPVQIGSLEPHTQAVERWINILNEMKETVDTNQRKNVIFRDKNNFDFIDKNGNTIIVGGDFIG